MNTRITYTKFWKDDFIAGLNPTEKLLFLYFLLNERVNIIHCYEVTDRELIFDTGLDKDIILKAKAKFSAASKVLFFKNFVYLKNAQKYETYEGPQNQKAKEKLINQMPQDVRDWYQYTCLGGIDTPINEGTVTPPIGTISNKSKIINHSKEATPTNTGMELLRKTAQRIGKGGLNV